jgi:hypothetical protein
MAAVISRFHPAINVGTHRYYFFPFFRNRIATTAIASNSGLLQQGREAGGQNI